MKGLFKEKISRFGSFISLIIVTMLLALFFLALPESLASVSGRIFAIVWALTAITVFTAHARHLGDRSNYQPRYYASTKGRKVRKQGERRLVRG